MEYEVEIKVKTSGTRSDILHALRETWTFGDNPRWELAGQAYVVEQTANAMVERICDQLEGSKSATPLDDESGRPRRK